MRDSQGSLPAAAVVALLTTIFGGGNVLGADSGAMAGRQLADKLCARCHATGPAGDSPFAAAPTFRSIAAKYDPADLAESLAEGISVGHEAMPQFAFSPEQIDDFIAYLRSLH